MAKKLSERQLMIVIAVIIGIVAGLAAFIFERAVEGIRHLVTSWAKADSVNLLYLVTPVAGIILVSLFVKKVVKDNISHGITKILYAITHKGSKLKPHNTYSSIVAGATTIGFGGSVGPEAPIVMTGAAIGSNIGRIFRMDYRNITILLGCGAAAALAAIFKAPVTGVIFVLEVLMLNLTIRSIIPVLIATVVSTCMIYFMHGFEPVFAVDIAQKSISLGNMPYYFILALLCGVVSYYIIISSAKIESLFKKIERPYVKWIAGGSVIGILIFIFPPLYGQGYDSITHLLQGDMEGIFRNSLFYEIRDHFWVMTAFLCGILVFKSIAMACTTAAGGVGGVFAPSIYLGAFTGYLIATLLNHLFGLDLPVMSFVLVGMAGVMSGTMDAPLTSIFLIAEISGGYRLFLPLMLVSAVSYGISYYFVPYSVYTRELVMHGDLLALNKERSILFVELDRLIEKDFIPVDEDMTLGKLVEVVSDSKRNIFPVVNRENQLKGVVTLDSIRKDMFDRSIYNDTFVSDYMFRPPAKIVTGDSISRVLDKFDGTDAWNLPVVDASDHYIGFVSKSKIFSEYRNELSKN